MASIAPMYGPTQARKTFVLCFDGTGNKFSGTASDSNILKIFRMLDRTDPSMLHYYQPGIGTYVDTKSVSPHTSIFTRFHSWYQKAKDSAIGTSFDDHVMGGYKFLMRYYSSGDDIFFFGFSRGAYIARFLAEMLDYVGLLSAGNEEMARFAWKAFARWQKRHGGSEKEEAQKKEMFEFLSGFRETFSRPVRRLRFLGLFDTVNSVPHFENAWLKRSKFPYTARSTALVIRHAVCIDERRAKFRQDLISETKAIKINHHQKYHHQGQNHGSRRGSRAEKHSEAGRHLEIPQKKKKVTEPPKSVVPNERYRRSSQIRQGGSREPRSRSISPGQSLGRVAEDDSSSMNSTSQLSLQLPPRDEVDDDEDAPQDIQEIWFPGCHADIGGGWDLAPGEKVPLSHGPLVWMVREARKAGLKFDEEKLLDLCCVEDQDGSFEKLDVPTNGAPDPSLPQLEVTGPTSPGSEGLPRNLTGSTDVSEEKATQSAFRQALLDAATTSTIHDCLEFKKGLKWGGVMWWNMMEYLPFRRMDLQPDNSWKSISWPLPKGEVRDIPEGAWIHCSAIQRMQARKDYRPGNLIIGGGGRGVKIAPPKYGIGSWEVLREEGDPVGMVYVRKRRETEDRGEN